MPAVKERLIRLNSPRTNVHIDLETAHWPKLTIPIERGEWFCDCAVEFAGQIFAVLGIEDPDNRIQGNFTITQTTYVMADAEKPTSYSDWLRTRWGLAPPLIFTSGN
jgi:hypothetical protein